WQGLKENMRPSFFLACLLITLSAGVCLGAGLGQKQARKLISRLAGAHLPTGAVRIKRISDSAAGSEATVEIETALRFVQDKQGRWRIDEIRIGQEQWEYLELLPAHTNERNPSNKCNETEFPMRAVNTNLSAQRARCLIASLLGIALPSDAVRVRDISALGLPFASQPSALVVALIEADVRFSRDKSGWRATDLRTGNGDWISVDQLVAAVTEGKRKQAQAELATLADALENFRRHVGFYVVSDKQPVLIDHLSPRYLSTVIRLDPWHNPYQYEGERDRFLLRSKGPDGKENTPDDIVIASPSRRPS
ncbi:MAG TPA: type II secretion system protein GspG, partial [Pyrinomonadaceae bacterium]